MERFDFSAQMHLPMLGGCGGGVGSEGGFCAVSLCCFQISILDGFFFFLWGENGGIRSQSAEKYLFLGSVCVCRGGEINRKHR